MTKKEYFELIALWRAKYRVIEIPHNPLFTKLTCAKCHKIKKKMHRHHKANDFMFARLHPEKFAARYVQFHPDDVVKLCARCHKEVHFQVYDVLLAEMKHDQKLRGTITTNWCNAWKARFLQRFEEWINDTSSKK